MANTREGTKQRQILEGQNNKVVGMTPVELMAVKFTDSDGAVDICLAFCFGKEADGGVGIYTIEPRNLPELLRMPHAFLRDGIRQRLAALKPVQAPDLPETALDGLDLPEVP